MYLLQYHRIFNIITAKTTGLHTSVHGYLKIPVKPLFCHIFITINTMKRIGRQFFDPLCIIVTLQLARRYTVYYTYLFSALLCLYFCSKYSLIVFKTGLKSLGLLSLESIEHGDVAVALNTQLCYLGNIPWHEILKFANQTRLIRGNKQADACGEYIHEYCSSMRRMRSLGCHVTHVDHLVARLASKFPPNGVRRLAQK